jgi:hypothetical protein
VDSEQWKKQNTAGEKVVFHLRFMEDLKTAPNKASQQVEGTLDKAWIQA